MNDWRIAGEALFSVNGFAVNSDFEAKKGFVNLLVGENGIGKSSFFRYLKESQFSQKAQTSMAFMDQESLRPLVDMQVGDIFATLYEELPRVRSWREAQDEYALEVESLLCKKISFLSGGENQRVKLLMTLMQDAEAYFLDEPLQFLDGFWQKRFLEIFNLLASQKLLTIIEHDIDKYNSCKLHINRMLRMDTQIRISCLGT